MQVGKHEEPGRARSAQEGQPSHSSLVGFPSGLTVHRAASKKLRLRAFKCAKFGKSPERGPGL